VPIQIVTDARDLWEAVRCMQGYNGNDPSLGVLISSLQEAIELGEIDDWIWVPTGDMIADCTTKWMVDTLLQVWYRTGSWEPSDFMSFRYADQTAKERTTGYCASRWICMACMAKQIRDLEFDEEQMQHSVAYQMLHMHVQELRDEAQQEETVYTVADLVAFFEEWGY